MTLDKEDCNMENFEGAEKESIQSKNELLIEPGDSDKNGEEFVQKNVEDDERLNDEEINFPGEMINDDHDEIVENSDKENLDEQEENQ